jgi:8-oxo-dGTP diphosphatase
MRQLQRHRFAPFIIAFASNYKRILRGDREHGSCRFAAPHARILPILKAVRGDGDGWVASDSGAMFWGRHGAAGLLLRAPLPDGSRAVLLQHRAAWSHQGGTWGLPGGARDSHETAEQTAVREAHEEAGLPAEYVVVRAAVVTATASGSHWTYTTVVADAPHPLDTVPNHESDELRWVVEEQVAELPLHPGFAASWRRLLELSRVTPLLQVPR